MSSPFTSSPFPLVVGPSLMMTAQSKKSRTAYLSARVETWARRLWTTRSGDLEAWITEAGPCPSARKSSSPHQSTCCSLSWYKLQAGVVSSALFGLIACTQRIWFHVSLSQSPHCAAAAGRYVLAGCQNSIKLLSPFTSPLQTELRRQPKECVLAGCFCTHSQQWLHKVAVSIPVSCQEISQKAFRGLELA